ncbi:MAG: membrane-associated protease RseP (regulator of RpoE activity) [Polyangiales bacterium]|jgi:membrane-associated protease RseP (regulator of RpoE activity)
MLRLLLLLCCFAAACAFPRRSTSLSPSPGATGGAPPTVVRIQFRGADIPARDRGGRPWDEDGSPPDSVVRIYRGDDLIFESEPAQNALQPVYDFVTPNLYLPRTESLRIELWDKDPLRQPAIIGSWRGRGLPRSAILNGDAQLTLEGRAVVMFRVIEPIAERGVGILQYEVRSDRLLVLQVLRFSPAGRAEIQVGDAILAIDGRSVSDLGEAQAASAISMSSSRTSTVSVERNGSTRDVEIDAGYVWQTR